MSEEPISIDINDPEFDANKWTKDALRRLLTKYDVDMEPKIQKKDYYVKLTMVHLGYMRKRFKDDVKKSAKKPPKGFLTPQNFATPSIADKQHTVSSLKKVYEKEELRKSHVLSFKKRAVEIESETESSTVFSDDNPFQSPMNTKNKRKTKKALDTNTIELPDELEAINTKFSPVKEPVAFSPKDSPVTLSEIINQKATKSGRKSPKSGRTSPKSTKKKTPKQTPVSFEGTPMKQVAFDMLETPTIRGQLPVPCLVKENNIPTNVDANKESLQDRLLRRQREKRTSKLPRNVLLGLLGILLSILSHWIVVDQPKLRYCSEKPNPTLFYSFLPSCIECPKDSICSDLAVIGCSNQDFKLKPSSLMFFLPEQVVPFPFNQPTCVLDPSRLVRDTLKKKQVEHLVQVVDVIVREYIGNVACSSSSIPKNLRWIISSKKRDTILGMPIELAKAELFKLVEKKWKPSVFDEYWTLLLDKITNSNYISLATILDDTVYQHRMFTTTNQPIISTSCKIRRAILKTAIKYSTHLLVLGVSLGIVVYFIARYHQKQQETRIVAQLVEDVVHSISRESQGYLQDPKKHPIPGLAVVQLRDYFLPNTSLFQSSQDYHIDDFGRFVWYVMDESSKNRIWQQVHKEIIKNSHIRETSTQLRGESHIVWMWVGPQVLSPLKRHRTDILFGTTNPKVVTPNRNE